MEENDQIVAFYCADCGALLKRGRRQDVTSYIGPWDIEEHYRESAKCKSGLIRPAFGHEMATRQGNSAE